MDPIEAFAAEARSYRAFVESAGAMALEDRLAMARLRLLALYTAALQLPSDPEPGDAADNHDVTPPAGWPGFGDKDIYYEVFDPYQLAEPVAGDLSDDVLDVYRDVCRGLVLWDAGQVTSAIWEWRFGLDHHWGAHAVDAIRALHRAIAIGSPG